MFAISTVRIIDYRSITIVDEKKRDEKEQTGNNIGQSSRLRSNI